jgi:hypothetical protein
LCCAAHEGNIAEVCSTFRNVKEKKYEDVGYEAVFSLPRFAPANLSASRCARK